MQPETGSIIPVPSTTLSLPFLFPFHMAVEGLWSPTLCYSPHSSYGGGLWPNRCRVWARIEVAIREDSTLAVLRGRTLPVMRTKWPYPATQRDDAKVFFFLFFLFMYYNEFRICSHFQPNCNDVQKDFTMWWEINTFISVQHLSRVLCLVNSCSLTISKKKESNPVCIIRKVEM